MKKLMKLFFMAVVIGLGLTLLTPGTSATAKISVVTNTTLDPSSSNIRNYVATGKYNLYDVIPDVYDSPEAQIVAPAADLANYKLASGEGLLRAYRVAKVSNGDYYMKVVSFDDAYEGWINVGRTNPSADFTKVAGGLRNVATTADSALKDDEKTQAYMFKQVGIVDDGTMLTYKAPKWTQYELNTQITDSTPYASDKLTISKAATRTREGDRWVYVEDANHPEVSGWILDTALVMIGGQITVNYVDEQGAEIATTKVVTGKLGEAYQTEKLTIAGYQFVSVTGPAAGQLTDDDATVTYHYKKTLKPVVTPSTPSTPTTTTPTTQPTTTPTQPATTVPTVPTVTEPEAVTANSRVAVKGQAIYAIRKVGLYRGAQFSRHNRITYYPKAKRINRPEFVVKGYKQDRAGHLRYRVQQYNPYTKRYVKGTTGYVTANAKYVVPAYYATKPKTNKIRVINPKGLYEYNNVALTGKQNKHVKVGATLKVTQVKPYKYTTRYRLTNGKFVTANKKFVIFEP